MEMLQGKDPKERTRSWANGAVHSVTASPQHFRSCGRRPVSGLTSRVLSPSQAFAQWPFDTPCTSLAYRCGGSTGIASFERVPVSRLTAAENFQNTALRHLAPLFRPMPATKARIIALRHFLALNSSRLGRYAGYCVRRTDGLWLRATYIETRLGSSGYEQHENEHLPAHSPS